MSKDAYYFSHDTNARTDPKIMAMLLEYKSEGYGFYWVIVEMLSEQDEYKLKFHKIIFQAIAMAMLSDINAVERFVNSCISDYYLFESDGEWFWSNSLIRRMELKEEKRQKRVDSGKKGAESRWNNGNAIAKDSNAIVLDMIAIAKDGKEKERKSNEIKEDIYSSSEYEHQVEKLWNLYPNKKGKNKAIKKLPILIKRFGYEQLEVCIERYIDTKEEWKQYQNGSTFFTSGYEDYLDANYQEEEKSREKSYWENVDG